MHFLSFLFLLHWLESLIQCWIHVPRGHPWLVLDPKGKTFSFSPLNMMLAICFSQMPFTKLGTLPSIPSILSFVLFFLISVPTFSSCSEWGLLLVAVHGLCIAMASCCWAQAPGEQALVAVAHRLQRMGSVVVAHGLSCSGACGSLPD